MKRDDWKWAIVGATFGLFAAYKTLDRHWDDLTSPLVSRACANVIGGVIGIMMIVYFVRWLRRET
jgi:hypothetical protein